MNTSVAVGHDRPNLQVLIEYDYLTARQAAELGRGPEAS